MPEFAPVQTEDTGDIDQYKLEPENQPGLGEENYRLEHYLRGQEELINKHLKAAKAAALAEYTSSNPFANDNEAAVNRAMQDYADKMNQAIQASLPALESIMKEKEHIFSHVMSIEDVQERMKNINDYYKLVADKWGPELEKNIISMANTNIASIVANAEARAEEADDGSEEPEEEADEEFFEDTKRGLEGDTRRERMRKAGV